MNINITIDGLDSLVTNLSSKIHQGLLNVAENIKAEEQFATSGKLSQSFVVENISNNEVLIDNNATNKGVPYAQFVQWGRGPVTIKYAPYLVFQINGQWFKTKQVGPALAQHFMEAAIDATAPYIEEMMLEAIYE